VPEEIKDLALAPWIF
jgi:hypothetical protein